MAQTPFDAVIFDLGGVLADFGGVKTMRDLTGIDSDDELWRRWLACEWVRRFERGWCSAEDFAAGVVADWSLQITPEAFLEAFRSWVVFPFQGAEELVGEVRRRVPAGCLSNTNLVHWQGGAANWPLVDMFDFRFLSFELGLLKPDGEVFDHVCRTIGAPADRLLFLDDNLLNVDAAVAAGLVAAHVRGIDEAREALLQAGVL
jgi:FMN phosphatase YigB (HAD superfamily)